MNDPDQRQSARIAHASQVLYREVVLGGNAPSYAEGSLIDLSDEGLAFAASRVFSKDDVLELKLLLYGWEKHKNEYYIGDLRKVTDPLVIIAVVTDCSAEGSRYRIGVRFDNVDPSHHEALRAYLKQRADGSL